MKETKEEIATNFDINEILKVKPKLKRVHLPITKEKEIARLYKEKAGTAKEIAKLYGISENYVYNILDKFNVPRHYPKKALSASINNWKRVNKLKREGTEVLKPVGPQIEMKLPKPKVKAKLEPIPSPPPVQLPPPPAAPKRKRTVKAKAKPKKSWARNLFDKVFNRK